MVYSEGCVGEVSVDHVNIYNRYLLMVRRRVERASLWNVMMMLVEGKSGSNVIKAHLNDSKRTGGGVSVM